MTAYYQYDPYGATTKVGTSTNTQQYTGRENDCTGLFYYRARYYHPVLGRFISEDPIGWGSGGFNLYAYVNNNPLRFVDPKGLKVTVWSRGARIGPGNIVGKIPGADHRWIKTNTNRGRNGAVGS